MFIERMLPCDTCRQLDFSLHNFDESDSISSFSIKSDVSESNSSISIKSSANCTDSQSSTSSSSSFSSRTAVETKQNSTTEGSRCFWQHCTFVVNGNFNILEHIQNEHVAPQRLDDSNFFCLWEGCKVFNKKSCSLSWLERHVLSHGGDKPFKCIFSGCGISFRTQPALERHVNSHISNNIGAGGTNGNGSLTGKKIESSPSKAAARRKKLKLRRQRQGVEAAQRTDYFDRSTMEKIKYRLIISNNPAQVDQHHCLFRAEELSWRYSPNEEPHVQVQWSPPNILPNEWIPQSQYKPTKLVPFRRLPASQIRLLYPNLFPPERTRKASRK